MTWLWVWLIIIGMVASCGDEAPLEPKNHLSRKKDSRAKEKSDDARLSKREVFFDALDRLFLVDNTTPAGIASYNRQLAESFAEQKPFSGPKIIRLSAAAATIMPRGVAVLALEEWSERCLKAVLKSKKIQTCVSLQIDVLNALLFGQEPNSEGSLLAQSLADGHPNDILYVFEDLLVDLLHNNSDAFAKPIDADDFLKTTEPDQPGTDELTSVADDLANIEYLIRAPNRSQQPVDLPPLSFFSNDAVLAGYPAMAVHWEIKYIGNSNKSPKRRYVSPKGYIILDLFEKGWRISLSDDEGLSLWKPATPKAGAQDASSPLANTRRPRWRPVRRPTDTQQEAPPPQEPSASAAPTEKITIGKRALPKQPTFVLDDSQELELLTDKGSTADIYKLTSVDGKPLVVKVMKNSIPISSGLDVAEGLSDFPSNSPHVELVTIHGRTTYKGNPAIVMRRADGDLEGLDANDVAANFEIISNGVFDLLKIYHHNGIVGGDNIKKASLGYVHKGQGKPGITLLPIDVDDYQTMQNAVDDPAARLMKIRKPLQFRESVEAAYLMALRKLPETELVAIRNVHQKFVAKWVSSKEGDVKLVDDGAEQDAMMADATELFNALQKPAIRRLNAAGIDTTEFEKALALSDRDAVVHATNALQIKYSDRLNRKSAAAFNDVVNTFLNPMHSLKSFTHSPFSAKSMVVRPPFTSRDFAVALAPPPKGMTFPLKIAKWYKDQLIQADYYAAHMTLIDLALGDGDNSILKLLQLPANGRTKDGFKYNNTVFTRMQPAQTVAVGEWLVDNKAMILDRVHPAIRDRIVSSIDEAYKITVALKPLYGLVPEGP